MPATEGSGSLLSPSWRDDLDQYRRAVGTVTVPTTPPGGGKKLHQKKRCRTERTTTKQTDKKLRFASPPPGVEPDSEDDFA